MCNTNVQDTRKLISLMTPCYNEEGNLKNLYARVAAVLDQLPQYDFEWIFIDNDSQDKSREILRDLAAHDRRIKVIFNMRNFGPGRSSAHGLYQTTGDASICLAADLQDPPELIPEFIMKWEGGAEVVLGHIAESQESSRAFATRGLFYKIINKFSDGDLQSHVTGFGLYSRRVVQLLKEEANPVPNFRFSIAGFGFPISYVDYVQPLRVAGKSSYNFISKLNTAIESLVQASTSPIRIITVSGTILACLSLVLTIVLLVFAIAQCNLACSMGAIASIVAFFAGLLALAVGVVGEYVVSALEYEKNLPLVIEAERINFSEGSNSAWVGASKNHVDTTGELR